MPVITFQRGLRYAGDAIAAPFKSVSLTFQMPEFEYELATSEAPDIGGGRLGVASTRGRPAVLEVGAAPSRLPDVIRRMTSSLTSQSIERSVTSTAYRIDFDDSAIAGADDAERDRARQYYAKALLDGSIDRLLVTASVQYASSDGLELGSTSLEFLCLLDLSQSSEVGRTSDFAPKACYFAVNRVAFSALRQSLAVTSLKGDESLTLQALSLVTTRAADQPVLRDDVEDDFAAWLTQATRGDDAAAILDILRDYYEALTDFALAIPALKTVSIGGEVTITAPAGETVSPLDFLDLEISADGSVVGTSLLQLVFRYSTAPVLVNDSAPFSLTSDSPLYENQVDGPVRVRVKTLGKEVWSKDFAVDDPALATLDIRVPKASRTVMTGSPKDAREPAAKKLRGRVLTLDDKCRLKDVLVLVQAKTAADAPLKVVGAATTDGSGNFAMSYPYGKYVQAQAIVSISPTETADVPCTGDGIETIADDFLYLLLTNPDCSPPEQVDDCDCTTDKPSRLPDQSDLIGSDVYSQDLGGTCINLSKPNRTISEFNYQAIVRSSDPDVATYTLTKTENGLASIDASLSVALTNGASELRELTRAALETALQSLDGDVTPAARAFVDAMESAFPHARAIATALALPRSSVTASVLATAVHDVDTVGALVDAYRARVELEDFPSYVEPTLILDSANRLRTLVGLAIDSVGTSARYELAGGSSVRQRQPISLTNPVAWQDPPEPSPPIAPAAVKPSKNERKPKGQPKPTAPQHATFSQAVTVATGHILHYKAAFKSDGYSLGDLIYSLPLAPGQKKEIVVLESAHTLVGAESQSLAQNERLALGLINERDVTNQLAGRLTEAMRGSSTANTSGISAGFGTGGQGSGGGQGYGGSGSAVIGIAGGFANANSDASQDSSRAMSQFFGERLRQSIMQNAEGYRQLNASVVTTVQEGQRYGVTSEVVANHNHCHALTMMYFEVLRHYAIFQELASVEECVFVPLLLTWFSTENVAKWRDVLAPALLPMPSDTYLGSVTSATGAAQHPLLKAFDADQRIRTNYANVDMPAGSYDDERIQFIRGSMRLRVSLPRPRTRFDRIMSLPVTTKTITSREIDPEATAAAALEFPRKMAEYATKTAVTAGLNNLFGDRPPDPPGLQYKTVEKELLVREAIFDAFMKLDANYESVPPAQCIRVVNFEPPPKVSIGPFGFLTVTSTAPESFFAENVEDQQQWQAYATLLGYPDVLTMLNAHFRGNLISEWDSIFETDIAPVAFEKILSAIRLQEFSIDVASEAKYRGGERLLTVHLAGTTTKKRNQLPEVLKLDVTTSTALGDLKQYITVDVQDATITYSTSHFNGTLFGGSIDDDLLDGTDLFIPENSEEKRNPRREDRYLAARLIEHLNSNLEYYNKVLWYNLDPDRRYMLLDGFSIQTFDDDGRPISAPDGFRSLASIVKNEVIAVAGNSLVMPVAPGYRVSGSLIRPNPDPDEAPVTLFDHYEPLTPLEPYRVSVPSKGVFAEAVQGICNACEKIETDRLQDWNRFPNTDEPTSIAPIVAPTPTVTDWNATFKDFATPMVNIQNVPALPAPGEGTQGLVELLGRSGVFKDITGLDANQQNVIRTYLSNQENAKAFAEMAKEMAMQSHNTQNSSKIMDSIASAKSSGAINQQEAGQLTKEHIQQQIDGGASKKAEAEATKQAAAPSLSKAAIDAAGRNQDVSASRVDSEGNSETVAIKGGGSGNVLADIVGSVPRIKQDKLNDCWAVVTAMMIGWKENLPTITPAQAVTRAGQKYLQIYQADTGLRAADKDDFALRSRLVAEPPANYRLQQYVDWVNTYGPIWITTDSADPGEPFSPHARLLTKVTGTGTPDGVGTDLTFIDPATGAETTQSFLEFVKSFEAMVTESKSRSLGPQVVHFIRSVESNEGFEIQGPLNIHEPIHETITLAALMRSDVAVPTTTKVGKDQAVNEFLRGVIWNDDPAVLMFDENPNDNWDFSWGIAWFFDFERAAHASANNVANLTGRSHYWDMQFLHAMGATAGEDPQDTLAKILVWAEVMYRLSIGEGVAPTDVLSNIAVSRPFTVGGVPNSYDMSSFFDDQTDPTGSETIKQLLTRNTACKSLIIGRRAIGSLLHLVQDSYARGHVRRTLTNPNDLVAGTTDIFKPGTYGKWGEVENFHCYRGQDSESHGKYDKPQGGTPDPTNLSTFNSLLGARDAIEASIKLLNMWTANTPWEAAGGPKELLEGVIFKLSAGVSPSDATVE